MSSFPQRQDDDLERERQLRAIGLPESVYQTALAAGDSAAARCTRNHPKMARGMYRFLEIVASLGEQTAELGWTREDHRGFATIVRPDRLVQIAVASGNDGTGDTGLDVSTRSPKGIATQEAVIQNLLLPLDDRYVRDNERIHFRAKQGARPIETWFLLHDERDGLHFAELSRPKSINENGYVETWAPRIPLSKRPSDPVTIVAGPDDPPPVDPIVTVKRRGSE